MLKPIGKRVLVKQIDLTNYTSSGILLAGSVSDVRQGEVVAVGNCAELCIGDRVMFLSSVGIKTQDGIVIGEVDILAVIMETK